MFKKILLFSLSLIISNYSNAANISIHKNEESGLLTWTTEDVGFKIELIQLLPDFIRAVYGKHHFPKAEIERAAAFCAFGTILKNTSNKLLTYRVEDWRYRVKNVAGEYEERPVKTKTQWLAEWKKAGIIFSWTLLPDVGEFEIGDWQQGFTTIDLPRESEFDLIYKWKLDDVMHVGTLKNIQCAPESLSEEMVIK